MPDNTNNAPSPVDGSGGESNPSGLAGSGGVQGASGSGSSAGGTDSVSSAITEGDDGESSADDPDATSSDDTTVMEPEDTPGDSGSNDTPTEPEGSAGSQGAGGSTDPGEAPTGLIGWAATEGCGPNGTTGGQGGPVVTVSNTAELIDAANSDGPLTIQLSGSFDLGGSTLQVSSDKTLLGLDGGAEIVGFLRVIDANNVILKNLKINGGELEEAADAAEVSTATCVWIDHCEFFDGGDGNLDIVRGSDLITVSWTRFYYVVRNHPHRLSNLCGNNDDDTPEKINITFHHNWWGEKILERMPRVRHGKVHIFNNYYSSAGNNYAIAAGYMAKLLVQNNVFDGVNSPIRWQSDQDTAEVAESGNDYSNASGDHVSRGSAFEPPYPYSLEAASAVQASVTSGAGVQ